MMLIASFSVLEMWNSWSFLFILMPGSTMDWNTQTRSRPLFKVWCFDESKFTQQWTWIGSKFYDAVSFVVCTPSLLFCITQNWKCLPPKRPLCVNFVSKIKIIASWTQWHTGYNSEINVHYDFVCPILSTFVPGKVTVISKEPTLCQWNLIKCHPFGTCRW